MHQASALPVSRSANGARHWPLLAVLVASAALITSVSGAFGTMGMPIGDRLALFGSVIALNAVKWLAWDRMLARLWAGRRAWLLGGFAGALILNLSLPFELRLAYSALGQDGTIPYLPVYLLAVLIALAVHVSVFVVIGAMSGSAEAAPAVSSAPAPAALPAVLARAGVNDPALLLGVAAEDHYLRLHLGDGRSPLLLYRFGDAVAELAPLGGYQVHRGAWVARGGIAAAFREGRKWRLRLTNGAVLPVSDRYLAQLRAAGVLGRRAAGQ